MTYLGRTSVAGYVVAYSPPYDNGQPQRFPTCTARHTGPKWADGVPEHTTFEHALLDTPGVSQVAEIPLSGEYYVTVVSSESQLTSDAVRWLVSSVAESCWQAAKVPAA